MFQEILFSLAVTFAVFLTLSKVLRQSHLSKPYIDLVKWLILILVALLLVSRYGLSGWRVVWGQNLHRRHFKPSLNRADLPESVRLYGLRHSCATPCLPLKRIPK
jgi:hypothetical protein